MFFSAYEKLEALKVVAAMVDDGDGDELHGEVHSYSGRGMYGSLCPAIVTNCPITLIEVDESIFAASVPEVEPGASAPTDAEAGNE